MLKTPKFWHKKNITSHILMPTSIITFFVNRLLGRKKIEPYKTKVKTICVGNAIMGGSGKTPTVIALHKKLYERYPDKKIVVISKGYKGQISGPHLVNKDADLASEVGDEPYIIAKEAEVIVAKNRLKGLQFAEKNNYDIAIFDDGLHDRRINYDIAYLVIDGGYGFGNGFIFPAGPLRDRLDYACKNADEVIIIGDDEHKILKKLERRAKKDFKINRAKVETINKVSSDDIYVAFAGLARPEKFFKTLENLKLAVVEKVEFADHYEYGDEDIEYLESIAEDEAAKLITTEKDYVKLPQDFREKVSVLKIKISFTGGTISKSLNKLF